MNDLEKKFYEIAGQEIASKTMVPGIFTKAFSDVGGDDKKTLALYIKLRVENLREEFEREQSRLRREESRRAEEQKLATEPEGLNTTCPKCHKTGYSRTFEENRQHPVLLWVLFLCGIIPAIIYQSITGTRIRCPNCKYILKEHVRNTA